MTLSYLKKRLYEIVWCSDLLTTRVSLAIGSLIWGLLLLWPGELFTPARTTYRLMSEIANENVWGVIFVAHSIVSFWQLITRNLKSTGAIANSFVGCILWTSSTIACFLSHFVTLETFQPPAALGADFAFVLASWWVLTKSLIERYRNG